MRKVAWTTRRTGALLATLLLGVGFLVTARFAGAETSASAGGASLGDLLDSKLDRGRAPSSGFEGPKVASPAPEPPPQPTDVASRIAIMGLLMAALLFAVALILKRIREGRMTEMLGSNLAVKDSVWIGRGQKILLVAFENHKVLVGVSGGGLHNLGMFGESGEAIAPENPIERAAARRDNEDRGPSDFSEFVKGELAGSLASTQNGVRDRRRRMITELNSL